jgi:hypothetical protein
MDQKNINRGFKKLKVWQGGNYMTLITKTSIQTLKVSVFDHYSSIPA